MTTEMPPQAPRPRGRPRKEGSPSPEPKLRGWANPEIKAKALAARLANAKRKTVLFKLKFFERDKDVLAQIPAAAALDALSPSAWVIATLREKLGLPLADTTSTKRMEVVVGKAIAKQSQPRVVQMGDAEPEDIEQWLAQRTAAPEAPQSGTGLLQRVIAGETKQATRPKNALQDDGIEMVSIGNMDAGIPPSGMPAGYQRETK